METKKVNDQKASLYKVWGYIGKYKKLIFVTLLLALFCVAFTIYVPVLVGRCIDYIVAPGQVDFNSIGAIILKIVAIVILTAIFQWIMDVLNNKITYQVVRNIRNDLFTKIQSLELKYMDSHSHGDLLSRVSTDVDQFSDGLLMGFTQLFSGVLTIIGILLFMLTISPVITLVIVLLTPLSLISARFIASRTYDMFHKQSAVRGEQMALLDEMIGNLDIVQAFSQEGNVQDRFDEVNKRLEKASIRALFFSSITNPTTRFINGIVYALIVLIGAFSLMSGKLSLGGLTALLSYVNQYTKPFNEISSIISELQNALACASRVFQLMQADSQPSDKDAQVIDSALVKGDVSLKDVAFSYTPESEFIKNFNLEVPSGCRVAIVGPTGCGKTTLINLLMRFYDVNSGSIKVDGMDVKDITRHSLRKSFGMVLQDTWLREGTVLENLTIGKPDATYDEVIQAAKASHAHAFIKHLPQGYNTMLSSGNTSLSQGQQQMLCITRVMLCLPPMLILDEATSSIDTRTELMIQDAFTKLMKGRTSFIVAHRLSTIRSADVILVMRDGKVIEKGDHQELLSKNGFYAKLYNSQFEVI